MKKLFALFATAALLLGLGACGGGAGKTINEKIHGGESTKINATEIEAAGAEGTGTVSKEEDRNYFYISLLGQLTSSFPTRTVTIAEKKEKAANDIECFGNYTQEEKAKILSYFDEADKSYSEIKVVYPDDYPFHAWRSPQQPCGQ